MRRLLAFALVLAFCRSACPAQDAAGAVAGQRIMVAFAYQGAGDERPMRESLEAALAASPLASLVLRMDAADEDLSAAAGKHSCPIALDVQASRTADSIRIRWSYSFPLGKLELRSGSFEKSPPGERDLVSSFWTELVQDLGPAIAALPSEGVTIAGPAGARIEGFGQAFTMPSQGSAELQLIVPAFVQWKATSKAFLDARGSALIEAPNSRIDIAMRRPPAWTAELSLFGLSFPEARASYLIGKRLFARATLTQFLGGLSFQNYSGPPPAPSLFSSFSLLQPGLGFGIYFEDPDRNLRIYAAADAFIRLSMPDYKAFLVDPVAPVGLFPLVGAEWGQSAGSKLYFELGGVFYPYAEVAYMLAARSQGGGDAVGSGQWWFGAHPGWFFEIPIPRLGMRIYFK